MIKLISSNVTSVSVEGVVLKTEKVAEGFLLKVEDDFKHLGVLFNHGFKVFEEKAAAVIRRSAAPGKPTGGTSDSQQPPAAGVQTPDPNAGQQ